MSIARTLQRLEEMKGILWEVKIRSAKRDLRKKIDKAIKRIVKEVGPIGKVTRKLRRLGGGVEFVTPRFELQPVKGFMIESDPEGVRIEWFGTGGELKLKELEEKLQSVGFETKRTPLKDVLVVTRLTDEIAKKL